MNDGQHIMAMVRAIQRRWLGRTLGLLIFAGLTGLLGWLLAMTLVDNLVMLAPWQLIIGWVVLLVGGLGAAAVITYELTAGRPDADRLALMYESRVPGQRNRLINAVQFLFTRQAEHDPMARAVVIENAYTLDVRDARLAIDFRPVRNALIALGISALLLLGYAAIRPRWVANGFARLLHPIRPPAHILATEPTVTPGDVELIEGQPLNIRAFIERSLRGHLPQTVHLEYRVGELDWTHTEMTAASKTDFSYDFQALWHPMAYRVRAGRSLSPTYKAVVRYRPHVERLQITVTRPPYAGGTHRQLKPNVGDVSALAGSIVELAVTASVPLSSGHLDRLDGSEVLLSIDPGDPCRASARFTLTRSGGYAIRLTDTRGLANLNPPRYTLTAEPDQPPVVVVTRPGRDLLMPPDASLPLTIEANDDIGLARLVLQTRTGTGGWSDTQHWEVSQAGINQRVVGTSLSLSQFGLKLNEVLLYRVVASDHRKPEPNLGVGRTWSVTVAEPTGDRTLLVAQAKQLLEALKQILALQRENRSDLAMDRPVEPIRARQRRIRELTVSAIDLERKSLRPNRSILDELVDLADGLMLQAVQRLDKYEGTYQHRAPLKPPILEAMDKIIDRLEGLIGRMDKSLAMADKAQQTIEQLSPEDREQALKQIRDLVEKLRTFIPEQDKVIAETAELARKGDDLTDGDLRRIEKLQGTEDKWAEVFTDSVEDINKLTEQGFADRTIANDYKEMVEQIEEASKNLTPELIEMAVPREQAGREMAESLAEDMEMWLPNSPDHIKWMMEEPLDTPEIPMVELPDQLYDFIGDLIEEQDELNDAAEDVTSAWADSMSAAGWQVSDGPISNFSAQGVTGNQLPDDHELSGRAGDGRSGRSQGQLVEDTAKGLPGRQTPTRITNDPYEQGVVKELQQMATSGATGGGKARGAGQEGLQGQSPPPLMDDMDFMRNWQQRIRQKAERVAGELKMVRLSLPDLDKSIQLMNQAELAAGNGRYAEMFKRQQMVSQHLRMAGDLAAREVALRIDRAYHLPAEYRRQILDAMEEPVPEEYQDAVRRYFLQLSEAE